MTAAGSEGRFEPGGSGGYAPTETAMSVLARKLRAELTVALMEDFVAGQRTGRSMLAEFDRVETQFRAGLPPEEIEEASPPSPDSQQPQVVEPRTFTVNGAGEASEAPEWERLRQQARDRGRPIALWELFHGLDTLARRQREGSLPTDRDISIYDVEQAMDLRDGVGESWSLHQEVATARAKLGADLAPAAPGEVAGMLLRVDAARTLIKPGRFEFGIRPHDKSDSAAHSMSESMMQRMEAQVQPRTIREMTRQAAVGLVGRGARTSQQRTDMARAMQAGDSGALARRAEVVAQAARERATELRSQRFGAQSSLLYAATAAAGIGVTAASLAGQTSLALQTTIGLTLTTLGASANFIKDWAPNSHVLAAPYKAFVAEKLSHVAGRLAARDLAELDQGSPVSAFRTAQAAMRSVKGKAVGGLVDRLERPPKHTPGGPAQSTAQGAPRQAGEAATTASRPGRAR